MGAAQRVWDEAKHPRGFGGKFATSAGGGKAPAKTARKAFASADHAALHKKTVVQLRQDAKTSGLKGHSRTRKADLVDALVVHKRGSTPQKSAPAAAPKKTAREVMHAKPPAKPKAVKKAPPKPRATALAGSKALDAAPVKMGKFGFDRGVDGELAQELDHEALDEYRASGFQDINEMLREGDFEHNEHAWMVHSIDAAMEHSKLTHDVQVHRGVSDLAMFGPAGSSASLAGLEFREPAFASTTADPAVAQEFNRRRRNRGKNGAILNIRVPKGTSAIQLSDIGPPPRPGSIRPTWSEAELLLQRGLKYRIVGDRVVDGVRQLDAEVVAA